MRILVTGAAGQLGQAFSEVFGERLPAQVTVDYVDLAQINLADEAATRALLRSIKPALVINCAAYTAVDAAEDNEAMALAINATAVSVIADELRQIGGALVHFSTDYVFDGRKSGAYFVNDAPNPLSAYGRTKLAGELAALSGGIPAVVFRTSWVFSHVGGNFMLTMIKLMQEREELNVVADQYGVPTSAWEMARFVTDKVVLPLIAQGAWGGLPKGMMHLVPAGATNWFEYASHVRSFLAKTPPAGVSLRCQRLSPINADQYKTKAQRPQNSRLDMRATVAAYGSGLGDWRGALDETLQRWARARADHKGT